MRIIAVRSYKGIAQQPFGNRSERAIVILGDQGQLDLGDLVSTPTAAANDDEAAEDKPVIKRPRAKRGIRLIALILLQSMAGK